MKKKDPTIFTGNTFGGAAIATEDGKGVAHWILAALQAEGFTLTGHSLPDGATSWAMRKAAETLDTAEEKLTSFKTEHGWQHFLRPGETLGGGWLSTSILP